MNTYIDYAITLLKSEILGENPPKMPEGMDIEALFKTAKKHDIANILYNQLTRLEGIEKQKLLPFREAYIKSVYVDSKQKQYLDIVLEAFEKNAIRHMPMKGAVIKSLYPSSEMRKSGDLDIFVDDENTKKVKEIMQDLGFETKSFNESVAHDEYVIGKAVVFEIHRQLISNKCPWDKKCQQIVDRIVLEEPYKYRYAMTNEDYYLYMIAHMAKHMKYSGIGIKMVLDVWVFLRHFKDKLDMEILCERLKECGLYEFDVQIRRLCDYWFCNAGADELTKQLALYIADSGTFGTHAQLVSGEMAQNAKNTKNETISKLSYYIKTFFAPYKQMKTRYPILQKAPVLLPFLWIHRACKTALFNKEKAQKIINRYENADMDYGKKIIEFKNRIGL